MTEEEFVDKLHRRLAEISIGSSALRNQGSPNIISKTRKYLYQSIDIGVFFDKLSRKQAFANFLDSHTEMLSTCYSLQNLNWGAARKSLNLFFRELVYNKFFAEYYALPIDFHAFNNHIRYLEVPLDKDVAIGIRKNSEYEILKWTSIKSLTPEKSHMFQNAANNIAEREGVARVQLDLIYWRPHVN